MNARIKHAVLLGALLAAFPAMSAELEKAKALRANGLVEDAKREFLELAFTADAAPEEKAEALLILGDIAEGQNNLEGARQNWNRLIEKYPASKAATVARSRLQAGTPIAGASSASSVTTPGSNGVLVVPDPKYSWAAPQIAGNLASSTTMFNGALSDALAQAKQQSLAGVIEVHLDTGAAFESGRVVCYRPQGQKAWEEKVMFNLGGGEERIARRFADSLAEKIRGRSCP